MTQARFNYTGQYFRFVFGNLKTCFVFSVIFSVFIFPVYAFVLLAPRAEIAALSSVLMIISVGGILVVGTITPLIAMKHLYTKTMADNILSLPLTAGQRYFCELGATLLCLVVPFAVISFPTAFAATDAEGFETLLMAVIRSVLVLIMLVCFNVLVMTFCGRLAEAILYPIALNILIPLFLYLATYLGMAGTYGLWYEFESRVQIVMWGIQSFLSPAGNVLSVSMYWVGDPVPLLCAVGFIALTIPLGLFVYTKRHNEQIGQPFVYRAAYRITSAAVAFVGVVCYFAMLYLYESNQYRSDTDRHLLALSPVEFPVLAVLLLILLLLMEIISFRRIRSVSKFALKYVVIFAAGTLVSLALYESDGFGESFYIPSEDETAYLLAYATDWGGEYQHSQMTWIGEGDEALSEYLRSVHTKIIEERSDGNDRLDLTYCLKDGSIVARSYFTTFPTDFFRQFYESESYKYTPLKMSEISGIQVLEYENGTGRPVWSEKMSDWNPSVLLSSFMRRPYGYDRTEDYRIYREIDYAAFREALLTDLKNDVNYGRHGEFPIGQIYLGRIGESDGEEFFTRMGTVNYTIYDSYTNTIRFLEQYGTVPTSADTVAAITQSFDNYTLVCVSTEGQSEEGQTAYGSDSFINMPELEKGEVPITEEEFLDAFSHGAEYAYTKPEREYFYFISCGDPCTMTQNDTGNSRNHELNTKIFVSEEYYDVLDRIFAERYIPDETESETENASVAVEYGCHAR